VAFSPDGKILAGIADGVVMLWNHVTNTRTTLESGTDLESMAFSPDGRTLATGGNNKLMLWPIG
jgi:WD40 repeat protein